MKNLWGNITHWEVWLFITGWEAGIFDLILRAFCLFCAFRIFKRRLYSVFFVLIRYCRSDRTSVIDRHYNPDKYEGHKLPFMDKLRVFAFRNVPYCGVKSDFKSYPYYYRLWDGDRVPSYLIKVLPSTLLTISFWVLNALSKQPLYGVVALAALLVVNSWLLYLSKRWLGLRKVLQTRMRIILLSYHDIMKLLSYSLMDTANKTNWKLLRFIVFLLGIFCFICIRFLL